MGDEFDGVPGFGAAEPDEVCGLVGTRVLAVVGVVAFAGDEVEEAVLVDVGESESVGLGDDVAVGVLGGGMAGDVVASEFAVDVFVPGEAVLVAVDGGDEVVVAVGVEVVNEDLGGLEGVVVPAVFGPGLGGVGGLGEPVLTGNEVGATVVVEVADAETVFVVIVGYFFAGDGVPVPRFERVFTRSVVAEGAVAGADDFGVAAGDEVGEFRGFAAEVIADDVDGPMLEEIIRAGVEVEADFFSGEAEDEDVILLVDVQVVDESEEVVGVGFDGEGGGFVEGVFFGEVGPGKPVGSVDEVRVTVVVEVTGGSAFRVEFGEDGFGGPRLGREEVDEEEEEAE